MTTSVDMAVDVRAGHHTRHGRARSLHHVHQHPHTQAVLLAHLVLTAKRVADCLTGQELGTEPESRIGLNKIVIVYEPRTMSAWVDASGANVMGRRVNEYGLHDYPIRAGVTTGSEIDAVVDEWRRIVLGIGSTS